jgi:hypothetical protein
VTCGVMYCVDMLCVVTGGVMYCVDMLCVVTGSVRVILHTLQRTTPS